MAISDFHASTIIETRASFVLSGFDEDPTRISTILGILPVAVQVRGSTHTLVSGKVIAHKESSWSLDSISDSKDINVHLRQLLDRLSGKEALSRAEWNPCFSVTWKSDYLYAGNGPFYEPDVIAGLARCGATLYQDIYQVDHNAG